MKDNSNEMGEIFEIENNFKETDFALRVNSNDYINAFTGILIFEKTLKKLFSEFLYKNTRQNLFYFFKNLKSFKKKSRKRIESHFMMFYDPNWSGKKAGRPTLAFDLGQGYDPAGEYNGDGAYFDLGDNLYELKTSQLIDILTFGELLEIINSFRTKSFCTFLNKKYKSWNFNFDTWTIFLINCLKLRNLLFHGKEIGIRGENSFYERNQKFSFIMQKINNINLECYN